MTSPEITSRRSPGGLKTSPGSLTKRLVNHARPFDVTEGYAADWTVEQLREPAQKVADRIDEIMDAAATAPMSLQQRN